MRLRGRSGRLQENVGEACSKNLRSSGSGFGRECSCSTSERNLANYAPDLWAFSQKLEAQRWRGCGDCELLLLHLWVVRFQASLCMRKPYSSQIPGIYVAAFYFCQICSFSYQIWSGLLFFQLLLGKETRSNKKQLCGLHENFTIILGVGPYCVVPIRPDHLPSPLPFLMAKISVVCLLVCFFHSLSLLPPLDHFFQEGLYIQSTYYWQKRSPWCIPTLPPPWCVKCI